MASPGPAPPVAAATPQNAPASKSSDYVLAVKRLEECLQALEAQRRQAAADVEELLRRKAEALVDPLTFVHKLRTKTLPPFPQRQTIQPLPVREQDARERKRYVFRSNARQEKNATSNDPVRPRSRPMTLAQSPQVEIEGARAEPQTPMPAEDVGNNDELNGKGDGAKVRGRLCDEDKPPTFNKLWTREEQARLEQLLISYPDEPVSAHRWTKIANALGDRTAKQVASRVQKFFIKLHAQNKPLPGGGRPPNICLYTSISKDVKRQYDDDGQPRMTMRQRRREADGGYYKAPSVYMDKDENQSEEMEGFGELDDEIKHSEEFKELQQLKRMKKDKERNHEIRIRVVHHEYKCNSCDVEPIVGSRFKCLDCPLEEEVDLCEECVMEEYEAGPHLRSHRFQRLDEATDDSSRDEPSQDEAKQKTGAITWAWDGAS